MVYGRYPASTLKELADLVEIQRTQIIENNLTSTKIQSQSSTNNRSTKKQSKIITNDKDFTMKNMSEQDTLAVENQDEIEIDTSKSDPQKAHRSSISWAVGVSDVATNKRASVLINDGKGMQKTKLNLPQQLKPIQTSSKIRELRNSLFNSPLFSPMSFKSNIRNSNQNNIITNSPKRKKSDDILRIVKGDPQTNFNDKKTFRYSMGTLDYPYPQEDYLDKPVSTESLSLTSPALIFFLLGFLIPPLWLISSIYSLPPNVEHRLRRPSELVLGRLSLLMIMTTIVFATFAIFGSKCWSWYYPSDYPYKC